MEVCCLVSVGIGCGMHITERGHPRYRRFPIPVFDINSSVNQVLDHRSVRVEIVVDVDVKKRKC